MLTFTLVFLIALTLNTAIEWWLAGRHLAHVAGHRAQVPEAFRDRISLEAHQKAADYTLTKTRMHRFELLLGVGILLLWTLGGGLDLLDRSLRDLALPELGQGVVLMLAVALISGLLDLPTSVYRTFGIEQRFGFNRTKPALFIKDLLKQSLLMLLLATPLFYVLLWLMAHMGELWWLYAWLVWMGFSLTLTWAYPIWIAPLFNKFSPLEDDELRERIMALLGRNGFTSQGIFVVDGSRRSGHGNAYFTGFGANKRIVFFDTLLESLAHDEIEAVLAHELGHFKRKHIVKRLFLMAAMSLGGLALLGWLMQQAWFFQGLGVSQGSAAMALILFSMAMPIFTFFLQPLMAALSRKHEFEADDFAAGQSQAESLIQALVKLYKENANTLTPDPLFSAFHDSHPPAPVRIAHLQGQ